MKDGFFIKLIFERRKEKKAEKKRACEKTALRNLVFGNSMMIILTSSIFLVLTVRYLRTLSKKGQG